MTFSLLNKKLLLSSLPFEVLCTHSLPLMFSDIEGKARQVVNMNKDDLA